MDIAKKINEKFFNEEWAGIYNERIDAKRATKAQRAQEKAEEKERKTIEREAARLEREAVKAEETANSKGLFNFFKVSEPLEEGYERLYEGDQAIDAKLVTAGDIVDSKFKTFEKVPSGQSFLGRNLLSSPLYILDGKDYLRVNRIYEATPEEADAENVHLVFDTEREYFSISFPVIRSF